MQAEGQQKDRKKPKRPKEYFACVARKPRTSTMWGAPKRGHTVHDTPVQPLTGGGGHTWPSLTARRKKLRGGEGTDTQKPCATGGAKRFTEVKKLQAAKGSEKNSNNLAKRTRGGNHKSARRQP